MPEGKATSSYQSRVPRSGRLPEPEWVDWADEKLLDLRICNLDVRVEGTELKERIEQLYAELKDRGLQFRPHFWLSDDWFTPDDVPGTGIPFYMAHPRLARLEQNQMLEVEGGTLDWCMRSSTAPQVPPTSVIQD